VIQHSAFVVEPWAVHETELRVGELAQTGCIKVEVDHQHARYRLLHSAPLPIAHHGQPLTVSTDQTATRAIPPAVSRETPAQPAGRAPARARPPAPNRERVGSESYRQR